MKKKSYSLERLPFTLHILTMRLLIAQHDLQCERAHKFDESTRTVAIEALTFSFIITLLCSKQATYIFPHRILRMKQPLYKHLLA